MREPAGPHRHAPLRRVATLGLVFVAAILSCGKDVTGPLASAARYVRGFAFAPVFPPVFQAAGGASSGVVQFSRVHVVLHHSDGSVALDTTIDFPPSADSLTADLTVKLLDSAPTTGEPMSLNLGYIDAAGDTVFRGGPVSVTAAPPPAGGGPNPPVKVPVSYTGPGSTAASVFASPRSFTLSSGAGFYVHGCRQGPERRDDRWHACHLEFARPGDRDHHLRRRPAPASRRTSAARRA